MILWSKDRRMAIRCWSLTWRMRLPQLISVYRKIRIKDVKWSGINSQKIGLVLAKKMAQALWMTSESVWVAKILSRYWLVPTTCCFKRNPWISSKMEEWGGYSEVAWRRLSPILYSLKTCLCTISPQTMTSQPAMHSGSNGHVKKLWVTSARPSW